MRKVVLCMSGGLDSTVLLYYLRSQGDEVRCLSVDYGQRHKKELLSAVDICRRVDVEHKVIGLQSVKTLLQGSSQTDETVSVPEGHYEAESMRITVIPNRNMLLLALASAWAISTKSDCVAYAAHAGDHAVYADCRQEFVDALGRAILLADYHQVALISPFTKKTKAEIVQLGVCLKAPLELTWSCYCGLDIHDGRCSTCIERQEAFSKASILDPTQYADRSLYQQLKQEGRVG